MTQKRNARAILLVIIFLLAGAAVALGQQGDKPRGHVREYYIAAEEVEWDYAPSGLELMHGDDIPYPWGLYRHWKKTSYVEFTDASFSSTNRSQNG